MVKLVLFSVLVMVAAMHRQTNAFGLVRIDVQKDNSGAEFATAVGNAISSKIQSWNNILNSLLQVKFGSVASGNVSSTSTSSANVAPLYKKVINVNSGYAPAAPSSVRVATRVDSSAPSPTYTAGRTLVTVNKSYGVIPAASVASSSATSASATTESTASNTIGYSYRKRFV